MGTLIEIIIIILLADLFTGMIHWWEDAYGNPNWKVLGKTIVIPNLEHHEFPRKFLADTFWQRTKYSWFAAMVGYGMYYSVTGKISWQLIIFLCYSACANELHAIFHRTDKENGKIICRIQKTGLIQSRKMHGYHHTAPYDCNYCVLTNYLNPVLNYIRFWQALEKIISFFGIKPIRNSTERRGFKILFFPFLET